ncbi:multivesicular body subunit 12B-like isoform X2 [Dreissena polymorpha]|uniref:Multivesicular body subunit 12A n=2 Tax=Dreissena polymorpha TaxID=45954 RepID=A0A9D4F9G4_DREPO|nr:multivesicular body subunit 12B-like isoform X2 [Dreissena polymorpha]KAH3794725.1 hypothetical protein DPMN_148263 [Dreissena polymorpha]
MEDWPIIGVVVVADINKCPAGFTTIDRTYDRTEEADLWRDGLFGRRVCRYLCVQRSAPQPGREVLVDISIITEKEQVPAGFTTLELTHDTREKATKKKVICVRWMNASITTSALSELIFMGRGSKKPPQGYTLVGELNNLMLCYKMSPIKTVSAISSHNSVESSLNNMSNLSNNLPYALHPATTQGYTQGQSAPYTQGQSAPYTQGHSAPYPVPRQLSHAFGPPERGYTSLGVTVAPLSGVPWQLSSKLQALSSLKQIQIPTIRYKSYKDIENEYCYQFDVERTAKANSG